MSRNMKTYQAFAIVALLLVAVGLLQSWNVAFGIFNLCIICAIMALGVNIQWGYGGLFNAGIMGFAALGGMAALLVSQPPIYEAWELAGIRIIFFTIGTAMAVWGYILLRKKKTIFKAIYIVLAIVILYNVISPAIEQIESLDSASSGYLGGAGLPIILSWGVGGVLAAGVAWCIGKVALGLRSDYLAIATLGISEIIIAFMKNEEWLTRGVKNVSGLNRPVPYEIELQKSETFINAIEWLHGKNITELQGELLEASSLAVKLCYSTLFLIVLGVVYILCASALNSGWGRMMRAIRDNETSAASIGKDIKKRHLQLFILGSAVVGIAGAMLTTLDGQFTPNTYQPLRFTFLIWVMVILGGSGNNAGAVLGGFLVWFIWIESEPLGTYIIEAVTANMEDGELKQHLKNSAQYMRLITMGIILLIAMRIRPKGLLPETNK